MVPNRTLRMRTPPCTGAESTAKSPRRRYPYREGRLTEIARNLRPIPSIPRAARSLILSSSGSVGTYARVFADFPDSLLADGSLGTLPGPDYFASCILDRTTLPRRQRSAGAARRSASSRCRTFVRALSRLHRGVGISPLPIAVRLMLPSKLEMVSVLRIGFSMLNALPTRFAVDASPSRPLPNRSRNQTALALTAS